MSLRRILGNMQISLKDEQDATSSASNHSSPISSSNTSSNSPPSPAPTSPTVSSGKHFRDDGGGMKHFLQRGESLKKFGEQGSDSFSSRSLGGDRKKRHQASGSTTIGPANLSSGSSNSPGGKNSDTPSEQKSEGAGGTVAVKDLLKL